MQASPLFNRITIIGLGLVGSSIARAAHQKQLTSTIVGCDYNEVSLAYGHKHGFIDVTQPDPALAVEDSDLVILATPPASLEEIAYTIAPRLKSAAIVMDVCSIKQAAIAAIAPHMPSGVHFMPAHPIAGSEQSGVAAGSATLFENKRVIVTPALPRQDDTLDKVTAFWNALGARVEAMPAHLHDMVYAYVSHLPQLLAFAAARALEPYEPLDKSNEALQRFLRLGASDADMWIEIFLLNKQNVLAALDRYLDAIAHIIAELKDAPPDQPHQPNEDMARTALFPRIAASCLITTVMEAEKKAGFPFARYAGTGFADFTYPSSLPPDDDIEQISSQYQAVASALKDYMQRLQKFRHAIASGHTEPLEKEQVATP